MSRHERPHLLFDFLKHGLGCAVNNIKEEMHNKDIGVKFYDEKKPA